MKTKLFLLIVILLSSFTTANNVSGSNRTKKVLSSVIKKTSKAKTKQVKAKKTKKKKNFEIPKGWNIANASYYDPNNAKQTKENSDGIGAFGREISSGSIALGSNLTSFFKSKKMTVFIYVKIKGLNIQTPYGENIFRVDDQMNKRYRKEGKFFIDFFHKDLDRKHKKIGRFKVQFKIHKIVKN